MSDEAETDQERVVRKMLEQYGYEAPVVVERDGDQLTILDGLERFKAGERSDKIDVIPVIVYDGE